MPFLAKQQRSKMPVTVCVCAHGLLDLQVASPTKNSPPPSQIITGFLGAGKVSVSRKPAAKRMSALKYLCSCDTDDFVEPLAQRARRQEYRSN